MRIPLLVFGLVLTAGCNSRLPPSKAASRLASERDYASAGEARAQDLFKSGQASSIEDARAQAAAEASQSWYEGAKNRERIRKQEDFEKGLKKSLGKE